MDEKILSLLNQLIEGQNETNKRFDNTDKRFDDVNSKLDRIEKKLDAVVEQTADLTEFRTEMKDFRCETYRQFEDIKNDLNNVEVITASNWKDIARLKSVK